MLATSSVPDAQVMGSHNLPSPPAEDSKSSNKKGPFNSKPSQSFSRVIKRNSAHPIASHHHDHASHGNGATNVQQKRVWKACERCRMKKTKCDGEFPCKRCKDDGLVCTAGIRKKVEFKQLPRGYAEVLETTQFALIATVHRLYSMVRAAQEWNYEEPDLNERGQPVIHDIARILGCIRPNSDVDLPVHSAFPEDRAGLLDLVRQLKEQNGMDCEGHKDTKEMDSSSASKAVDRTSPSDSYQSEADDYRQIALGSSSGVTLSPESFTATNDFDFNQKAPTIAANVSAYQPSPFLSGFTQWHPGDKTGSMQSMNGVSLPLLKFDNMTGSFPTDVDTMKPNFLANDVDAMLNEMDDSMTYGDYDVSLRF